MYKWEDGGMMSSRERATLRFGIQMLKYSKVRKRRWKVGPWTQEGSDTRIKDHSESKERLQ